MCGREGTRGWGRQYKVDYLKGLYFVDLTQKSSECLMKQNLTKKKTVLPQKC